jgi:hypothetical protein
MRKKKEREVPLKEEEGEYNASHGERGHRACGTRP